MRSLKTFMSNFEAQSSGVNEAKNGNIKLQPGAMNTLEPAELQQYFSVAGKYLSDDGVFVIEWLINNPELEPLSDFEGPNKLYSFYQAGQTKVVPLAKLYKALDNLAVSYSVKEVPVFQTRQEFDSIMTKKKPVDFVVYDFESELGRNHLVTKYLPLMHSIANSYVGKTSLSKDDLFGFAQEGFTWALNRYGKPNKTMADDEKIAATSFVGYASWMIRNAIRDGMKREGDMIRKTYGEVQKERATNDGKYVKQHTIDGDATLSKSEDAVDSLFTRMADPSVQADSTLSAREMKSIFSEMYKAIENKFGEQELDRFQRFYGLNGKKQAQLRDFAREDGKENVAATSLYTMRIKKILNYLSTDSKMKDLLSDFLDY